MSPDFRLAIFSSEYPPYTEGGLGTHVEEITAELARSVHVDLFVPAREGYQPAHPAIRLHEVAVAEPPAPPRFWIEFGRAAARAASEAPSVELIHCHDWMTALAGVGARRLVNRPMVCNIHLPQHGGPTLLMENLGLIAADLVLVNSEAIRAELMARNLPCRRLAVVPNGVDPVRFHPCGDWPADGGYILFAGRLVPQKGVEVLLRAFGVLLRRCPESRLVVVGEGFLELYLRRVARYLGFADRVSFIQWQKGAALVKLYQEAQVVVVPSYYEPFGIVALEAMACGRPVVASRTGGLAEMVEDGVHGFLVDTGDYLDLARRLAALVLAPELRREMGQAARERAIGFGWDRIARKTLALYEEVLAGPVDPQIPAPAAELLRQLGEQLEEDPLNLMAGPPGGVN